MATKAKPKAQPEASEPETPVDPTHSGWAHDWRNPDAVFAADDHCPNAELRRLAPQ